MVPKYIIVTLFYRLIIFFSKNCLEEDTGNNFIMLSHLPEMHTIETQVFINFTCQTWTVLKVIQKFKVNYFLCRLNFHAKYKHISFD